MSRASEAKRVPGFRTLADAKRGARYRANTRREAYAIVTPSGYSGVYPYLVCPAIDAQSLCDRINANRKRTDPETWTNYTLAHIVGAYVPGDSMQHDMVTVRD